MIIFLFYKHFINEIFIIFSDETKVQGFCAWVNEQHSTIKFSYQHNKDKITFLDTEVYYNEGNKLSVCTFFKPTDRNSLLEYNIFHPTHIRNNLPYSQF